MSKRLCMSAAVLAISLAGAPAAALAQDGYPAQPVRLVVGFAPGGSSDLTARLWAQKLSAQMNASVFVDNKPGANGNIGAEFVAKSKPDGYTLMLNTPSQPLSQAFGEKLGYDMARDFAPIALVFYSPLVLIVHPSIPAASAAQFIALVKRNPNKLNYGSAGTGSINHMGGLVFLQVNGLVATHVPYKGGAPMMTDLASGQLQFSLQSVAAMLPFAKTGRVKPLGIAGLSRSALLPEVPTLSETVMPGFEVGTWYGIAAPAKTPAAIIRRLNGEIVKLKQDADMKARMEQEGGELLATSPEEATAYVVKETERWTKVVKTSGVRLE